MKPEAVVPPESLPIDTLRTLARDWCDFATNGDAGRCARDPVYQRIVEGRDSGPYYSSCADLAHWLLFTLGSRSDCINRTEHNGWKSRVNVSRLVGEGVHNIDYSEIKTGDICVTWKRPDTSDAHVFIFDNLEGDILRSWDYGQGPLDPKVWRDGQHVEGRKRVRSARTTPLKAALPLANLVFNPDLLTWPVGESFDDYELPRK